MPTMEDFMKRTSTETGPAASRQMSAAAIMGKVATVFLISVLSAALFVGCSGSKKSEDTSMFDVKVNFQQFRQHVADNFNSAPVKIDMFYMNDQGVMNDFIADTPLNEYTFKVPKTAVLIGVAASVLNIDHPSDTFDDWAGVAYQFVFNNQHDISAIEDIAPFAVIDDFARFSLVEAQVRGVDERVELYFNGEHIDLEERIFVLAKAAPRGPSGVPDTRYATDATPENSIWQAFLSLGYYPQGTRYKIQIPEGSGNIIWNHFQGMGWYRNNTVILTHSASSWDVGERYPMLYMNRTDNSNATWSQLYMNGEYWHHPGGGQVIENYFVGSATRGNDGKVYSWNLETNLHLLNTVIERPGHSSNAAAGVTRVNARVRYGGGADVSSTGYKYIIGVVDYTNKRIELYRSSPAESFSQAGEWVFMGRSYWHDYAGKLDNIALFTEYDDNIYMLAFDADAGDTNLKLFRLTYKLNNSYLGDVVQLNPIDANSQHPAVWLGTLSGLTRATAGSENMGGRWGATAYFDGKDMHIFMSERNHSLDDYEVSYNHWRSHR